MAEEDQNHGTRLWSALAPLGSAMAESGCGAQRARSRVSFCQEGRLNNRTVEFVVKNGEAVLLQHCKNIRFDILKHLMKLEKETV